LTAHTLRTISIDLKKEYGCMTNLFLCEQMIDLYIVAIVAEFQKIHVNKKNVNYDDDDTMHNLFGLRKKGNNNKTI
jgi:hypothetical protein